ncbi:thiamine pyrophosphate-dependent dehydrogenase E1 component subunit alpha [Streptomyces sp. 303MFCol5.2]|uniref:thiamine pyrophosphate-dependent dehydrogenase E1 component subunit alpha n=1 Tax=Streptomyces sp. 303MFCol5.2 TaxID=1172181 RepID=UPI0003738CD9|nr:thiamine pyrophosphate-dependent dehydrogenase E1 component subunit alpha [Streptomyces sp. 303MFCol5.2]
MPRTPRTSAKAKDRSSPIQLLTPEGEIVRDTKLPFDPLSADLPALYRDMVMIRRLDTEAIALQRQGELGLWPSLFGQEAAQVGAARALLPTDMVFPTYREHGVAWCRGLDPASLLGLFRGTTLGGWDPADANFNLYTLVIGAQTLHGVGYAMGIVRDLARDLLDTSKAGTGELPAVLVFLGDGALSEGETNEAFIWATTQSLPVVFFCQNNQWAISAPYSVQSTVPVAQRAAGFGLPGVRVDGNDVLACLAATRRALRKARTGGGPTLIEAFTYRRNAHTTADDASRYRESAEEQEWAGKDPIARLHAHLTATGAVEPAFFDEVEAEAKDFAEGLRSRCRALPEPDASLPFEHTYAEMTPELHRQLAQHRAHLASLQETAEHAGDRA